jgi:hypothetical protein
MIIKSRVTGTYALEVFENFTTDFNLPKHKKENDSSSIGYSKGVFQNGVFSSEDSEDSIGISNNVVGWSKSPYRKTSWKVGFVKMIERMLGIPKKEKEVGGKTNPMEILLSVSGNLQEAKDYTERLKLYDDVINQARMAGQQARVEKLISARKIVEWESLLLVSGFGKYLSEDTAIGFALKCQKGLRLDWVKNFARPIPVEVIERKVGADKLKVFDNYVVMHYDPKGQAFALTKAQEEAKKDPILFGVVKDVRKLYFIGDWKDDECDLTMDEVEKVLGRSVDVISNNPEEE